MIRVAKNLELPLDLATDTVGILSSKGTGKTYTALVVGEDMIDAGVPVVVFDPIGVAWGLRLAADGKGKGLPVIVLGGSNGDLPLEPEAGHVLADFVASERRSVVLDTSGFGTKADQLRFMRDFLERLYQVNREPLHLILDEVDDICPQKPFGEETRVLRAVEVLVRRGRARGLGVTLITQRAAVVNKNVLTQISTLIVGRTVAPQDRAAIGLWLDAHGTPEQKRELLASLSRLEDREKWVWSPHRDVFARVTVRARRTFDSSRTPKIGEVARRPAPLAPVDLGALQDRIAATIEKSKADDPKVLRARIAELERAAGVPAPAPPPEPTPMLNAEERALLERFNAELSSVRSYVVDLAGMIDKWGPLGDAVRAFLTLERAPPPGLGVPTVSVARGPSPGRDIAAPKAARSAASKDGPASGPLKRCEREILRVLAQRGPSTRTQVAIMSGYSARSGGFANALGTLRSGRLIEGSESIALTPAGRSAAGATPPLPRGKALLDHWCGALGKRCEKEILTALFARRSGLGRAALATTTGYSAESGGFANALGKLRTLELITRSDPIRAADVFFEGASS